jgi:hypothetical protein
MNDLYNETIKRNGRIYHYDPDQDIYYCRGSEALVSIFGPLQLGPSSMSF